MHRSLENPRDYRACIVDKTTYSGRTAGVILEEAWTLAEPEAVSLAGVPLLLK